MFDRRTGVLLPLLASLLLVKAQAQSAPAQTFEPASKSMISARDLAVPSKAAKEFKRGDEACAKADWRSAIEHFRKAIAEYPPYASAYNNLGSAYDKRGDAQAAADAFRQAISLDDHLAAAYVNLARVLEKQQRWSDAEPLLTRVLSFDPRNGEALLVLSYVQLRLKDYDHAAANAVEASAINGSQFALAYYIAGMALQASNRASQAAAEYAAFLKASPNSPFAPRAQAALQELESARR